MPLTGPVLPVGFGLLASACLVALVLGWPNATRAWLRGALRGLQAVGFSACCVLLAAALLNDEYLFYVSWGDLLNTGPVHTHQLDRGDQQAGARVKLASALTPPPPGTPYPALPTSQPGQRLFHFTVHGSASGVTSKVLVYLPVGYDPNVSPTDRYPVLESLHGYPGTMNGDFKSMDIAGDFERQWGQAGLPAPVIVMPQINNPPGLDTECVDDVEGGGASIETFLAVDVPKWVVQHFAVQTKRTPWATIGFSFGGWCAAMLAMEHPDTYGAGISFMGYYAPEFGRHYQPFAPGSAEYARYDLTEMAAQHPPPVSLFLMASKQDAMAWPPLRRFLRAVKPPMAVRADVLSIGGHRVSTIPPEFPTMMKWLGTAMPGFAPATPTSQATPTTQATQAPGLGVGPGS